MPKEQRAKYGTMGVAIDDDFEPLYIVDADKKAKVSELKKKLKDADELLLATDEDREGEAIAWHLLQELKPKVPVRRMVFHEITRDAIQRALGETRDVDQRLVDAQETRRILDRLYGYEVSPVLWKKVMQGLSAGRVQSVAVRLVVERERERRAFVSAGYWDIDGVFDPGSFEARLAASTASAWRRAATSPSRASCKSDDLARLDEAEAREPGGRARRADVRRPLRRREAVHAPAGGAVHDLDAAAGGEPQAPLQLADDDAGRPAPVRERLHHLHAHRLDDAVGVRARPPRGARRSSSTAPTRSRTRRASTRARSRTRRRRTRRSGPPATPSGRRSSSSAS